uniref:Serpentine receptor class gamma n=1 Tax=Panagrolaimus davidi TaxID=227884 RepID=A0A914QH92_9BILA
MTCVQFLGHVLLAFNRFTLLYFPIKHKNFWSRQWYTAVLIIASFLYISWKFAEPVSFLFIGTNVGIALVDKNMSNIYYILSTTFFLTTTLITAILNVFTFIKFCLQKKNSNALISIKERNLLYVSFFVFISQVFRASYNVNRVLFPDNQTSKQFFETIVPVLYDIFAWSGSVSLIILSSSTRKKYMEFYFCKSKNSVTRFTSTN